MPTSVNVTNLKINELKESQYDTAVQQGVIGENEISILTDADVGGLPSQTGNAGKFLTTDGTDASWSDKPLVNTATGTGSLTIGGVATTKQQCINIGAGSMATENYTIQIGNGSNSTAGTMSVGLYNNSWHNYRLLSADGTIPHARLTNAVQSTTVTIATTDWSSNTASVTVSGLTATSVVWVAPDNASQSAYTTAGVYASSQSADTLTFTCTQTPSASLTVNIVWC